MSCKELCSRVESWLERMKNIKKIISSIIPFQIQPPDRGRWSSLGSFGDGWLLGDIIERLREGLGNWWNWTVIHIGEHHWVDLEND